MRRARGTVRLEATPLKPTMPRLLIADDHPLFRTALRQAAVVALGADAHIEEAADMPATLRALAADPELELTLLDLHMPGSRGLSGLTTLRGQFPAVAVMVVSAHDEPRVVRRALDYGAAGYITKSAGQDDITAAIRTVLDGGEWVPSRLARQVAALPSSPEDSALAARLTRLTEQQYRVLELVAEGLLNKQIAGRLSIQERTVKAHITAIFEKLGVHNRTQAGILLRSLDLVDPAGKL